MKKNEFYENLKDENMIMETLMILRFLRGILHKEFHKVQDVVKKKTKAVENYWPSRHCHRLQVKLGNSLLGPT